MDLTINDLWLADLFETPLPDSPFKVVGGSCHNGLTIAAHGSCVTEVALEPSSAGFFQNNHGLGRCASFATVN